MCGRWIALHRARRARRERVEVCAFLKAEAGNPIREVPLSEACTLWGPHCMAHCTHEADNVVMTRHPPPRISFRSRPKPGFDGPRVGLGPAKAVKGQHLTQRP